MKSQQFGTFEYEYTLCKFKKVCTHILRPIDFNILSLMRFDEPIENHNQLSIYKLFD